MNTPEGSATARRGGILELNAAILAAASVVGGKEREGPLGGYFDFVNPGDRFGMVPAPPRRKDFCWRLHWSARALPPVPES